MTQKNLPLGDELWPMEAHVHHRPPQTQCAMCCRVVEQAVAFRSPTEDFCCYECYVLFQMSECQ